MAQDTRPNIVKTSPRSDVPSACLQDVAEQLSNEIENALGPTVATLGQPAVSLACQESGTLVMRLCSKRHWAVGSTAALAT